MFTVRRDEDEEDEGSSSSEEEEESTQSARRRRQRQQLPRQKQQLPRQKQQHLYGDDDTTTSEAVSGAGSTRGSAPVPAPRRAPGFQVQEIQVR